MSNFWAKFFLLSAKNYRHGCRNCNLRIFSRFWRKNIYFLKLNMISTFFGVWDEKSGSFSQKVFFRVQPTKIRASRAIFWGKSFLFPKCFFFLLSIMEFDWFLCIFPKLFSQVCQITDQLAEKKIWGVNLEKLFFESFLDFEEKNLYFQQNSKAWFSKP